MTQTLPLTATTTRLVSVDFLRGIIMLLMIVDHAREYSAGPGGLTDPMTIATTPPDLFWFRWVTHFCAPVFTLLMGISVYLSSRRGPIEPASRKTLTRGFILLAVEFTLVDWGWTFNPLWHRKFFQVIAALGVSMIVLSLFMRLPRRITAITAIAILAFHNLFDGVRFPDNTPAHYIWSLLHQKNVLPLGGGFEFRTTYPVLPIIGVALLGYVLGPWIEKGRTRALASLGASFIALFFLLRTVIGYGDSGKFVIHDSLTQTLMSLGNVTKYPLSLQFVLMTTGPALILLAFWHNRQFRAFSPVLTLGRVPMFYYVVHGYILHLMAFAWALFLGFPLSSFNVFERYGGIPKGAGFPLWGTLLYAAICVALVYPLCRWYEQLRLSRRYTFTSYF